VPSGKLQRVITPHFVDVIREGANGVAWKRLVEAVSAVPENEMSRSEAQEWAEAFKKGTGRCRDSG